MKVLRTLLLSVVILAASCGGVPSTADYAAEVEALVTTMNARLDGLDVEVEGTQDLQAIRRYAEQRVLARNDFLIGLRALNAPNEVAELHDTALEIIGRVTAAETAMADLVMASDSVSDIEALWETPEGIAARTADAQAVALCLAAQAGFDQTSDRAELEGVPWIPTEMKEVIRVAFGCDAKQR
jgi:hypothetical protein